MNEMQLGHVYSLNEATGPLYLVLIQLSFSDIGIGLCRKLNTYQPIRRKCIHILPAPQCGALVSSAKANVEGNPSCLSNLCWSAQIVRERLISVEFREVGLLFAKSNLLYQ